MNDLTKVNNMPGTVTSNALLELINRARSQLGESPVRRNDFNARIVDELEGMHYEHFVVQNPNRTMSRGYLLTHDQCLLVSMRESKAVRRSVLDQLKRLEDRQKPSSVPETLPEALRLAADLAEQKQAAEGEVKRLQSVCETIANQFTPGLTPTQFARMLNGVNIRAIQGWMVQQGMLYPANHGYMASSRYRDAWFVQKVSDARGAELPGRPYVTLTLQGAKAIYKRYLRGALPMKTSWDGKFTHDLFDLKQVA
ncbi:MAG: hypothetical protein LAT65_05765 [Saccharospirillum sp.]|nr:hypothetical protein [Saccharospirillum sp.]